MEVISFWIFTEICKYIQKGVNDLGDEKMGKNIETENFVIFCFETIALQNTLIEWMFQKLSF